MNEPFTVKNAAVRRQAGFISPERLATLKMIFEAVCDEAAIAGDAEGERDALATRLLIAGETTASEMMLVLAAMKAVSDYRLEPATSVQ